jgi:hypothetical protein
MGALGHHYAGRVRPRRLLALLAVLAAAILAVPLSAVPAAAAGNAPSGRVVVIGIDGLQWSDVTQDGMPTLYSLVGTSDTASLVTRGPVDSTCPADGWLTLNTGSRTTGGTVTRYPTGTSPDTALITTPRAYCAPLPTAPANTGPYDIPDFAAYTNPNAAFGYVPVFGSLQAPINAAGGCVAASGAGALLGAADRTGHIADYLGAPGALTADELARCALTLVDLGGTTNVPQADAPVRPTPQMVRAYSYTVLDAEVGTLLAKLPAGTAVVIAGLDDSTFSAHLHAVLVTGKSANGTAFEGAHWLYASSTRHPGLVQTLDLTPSLLRWVGLTPAQISAAHPNPFTGSLIGTAGNVPAGDTGGVIVTQARLDVANATFGRTNGLFITWMAHAITILVWTAGLVFAAVHWLPERLSPGRYTARWPFLARWRGALTWAVGVWAAALSAIAPASFLADLAPWSGAGSPGLVLFLVIAAIALVLTAATLAISRIGPLRDRPMAPAGLLGLFTLAVIGVDVITGSNLQAQTPFGLSYTIAGRFYGIGNGAVGVYCAAAMVGATWVASLLMPHRGRRVIAPHVWPRTLREAASGWLHRAVPGRLGLSGLPEASRNERRRALTAVGVIALFAIAACGYPSWGSKFGGTIAMVPGFVLLVFLIAGLRITWRKLVLVAISGVVVVSGFAAVNYLQPAGQRSHFGNFVASWSDGTWTVTIHRKIQTNLASVNNDWFSHYVAWTLLWALLAVVTPRLIASRTLTVVYAREPFIRCALLLSLLTVGLGWFVDDSGILVPKMALFLAVPLAVLCTARTLRPDAVLDD